jgi:TolB-like protein
MNTLEDLMKKCKICLAMALAIAAGLTVSCASVQDRTMTPQERAEMEVIGTVTASWTSFSMFHIPASKNSLITRGLSELKKEAAKKGVSGNIDFRNISVTQGASPATILLFNLNIFMDIRKNTASADVVIYRSGSTGDSAPPARARSSGSTEGIEGAINRACGTLLNDIPRRSTVAVLSVSSRDRNMAVFVVDEIEFQLVDARQFDMVDRKTLDSIRDEQNFQMSGDVSDASAVSIGNMLGASVVITGAITGSENTQRLTVKALDVKTAKIITMAREQF